MIITTEEAIERIAAQTVKNKEVINRSLKQRRHQVVDMYGVEYTRDGDKDNPARFYISISPDMVYLERFEFKLIVQPFLSTGGNSTGETTVKVNPTSLSGSGGDADCISDSDIDDIVDTGEASGDDSGGGGGVSGISPNPHSHTTDPHSHSIVPGITQIPTTASDFRIKIEGIDVTPYLMAQYGSWINGEGIYPSLEIGKDYDILEVASDMRGEGRDAQADKLVHSGYKLIEITSGSPFRITLVNYLKYSHLNR